MPVTFRLSVIVLLASASMFAQQFPFALIPNSPKNIGNLFEDSDGRLWVGTLDDLLYFDGTRFYSLRELGFPKSNVKGIGEDQAGGVWAATNTGVYLFSKGQVQLMQKGYSPIVAQVSPGVMLAALDPLGNGDPTHKLELHRFKLIAGSWQRQPLEGETARVGFSIDSRGSAIYACPLGVCELTRGTILNWRRGDTSRSLAGNPGPGTRHIFRNHFDCMWFRSEGEVSYQCSGGPRIRLPLETASLYPSQQMAETGDGDMIIPSVASLSIGRPGSFRTIRAANGVPASNAAIPARDGTLWVSSVEGLYRLPTPLKLEYWTAREGLESPFSVLHLGRKIFAPSGAGLSELTNDRNRWTPMRQTQCLGLVLQLSPGPNGTIFANRQKLALLRPDGTVVSRYDPKVGLMLFAWRKTTMGGPGSLAEA